MTPHAHPPRPVDIAALARHTGHMTTNANPVAALLAKIATDLDAMTVEGLVNLYATSTDRLLCEHVVQSLLDRRFTDEQLAAYCHAISYVDPFGSDEAWKTGCTNALRAALAA